MIYYRVACIDANGVTIEYEEFYFLENAERCFGDMKQKHPTATIELQECDVGKVIRVITRTEIPA